MRVFAGIWAVCVLVAIAASIGCSDDEDDRGRLEEMEQEILDYAGSPVCEEESECRYVGVGAKPCGGPWYYLVYSVSSVDSLKLAKMVSAYNEYNDELNRKHGWNSDCSVPNEPELVCQDGRCVDLAN